VYGQSNQSAWMHTRKKKKDDMGYGSNAKKNTQMKGRVYPEKGKLNKPGRGSGCQVRDGKLLSPGQKFWKRAYQSGENVLFSGGFRMENRAGAKIGHFQLRGGMVEQGRGRQVPKLDCGRGRARE